MNLNDMINTISKKLGTNPEKLKQAVQSGNANEVLKNTGTEEAQKVEKILSDKDVASKLLSTPKAQQLFKKVLGEK